MKKIFSLFVLMLVVLGVQAKTDKYACNVTFPDSKSANCEYNTSTKVFSWTAKNNNSMRILSSLKGNVDLTKYKWLNVKVKNLSSDYRILIYCDNNGSTTSYNQTFTGDVRIDLTSITLTTSGHTYANINNINIAGSSTNAEGSLKIEEADVYLETDEYEYMGITKSISDFTWYTYDSNPVTEYTATSVNNGLNNSRGQNTVIYGFNAATVAYIDATGYDNAKFTLSTAGTQGIRLMYNNATITIETNSSSTSYTQSLSTMPKIATIKTKNVSNLTAITVSAIDFVKEYMPASTTAFNVSSDISGNKVNYDRTFTAGRKATVCLPFALTTKEVSDAGTFYELTDYDGSTLTFSPVTETVAYKPYLFEANATGTPFSSLTNKEIVASSGAITEYTTDDNNGFTATFHGTLNHQGVNGKYGWDSSNGKFSIATTDDVTIDAFRAYITVSGVSGARSLRAVFDDDITDINEVKTQKKVEDGVMYNLSGQRVDASYKGIVVKNGKKYYNK